MSDAQALAAHYEAEYAALLAARRPDFKAYALERGNPNHGYDVRPGDVVYLYHDGRFLPPYVVEGAERGAR